MNDLLLKAQEALYRKNGRAALEYARQLLDQEETNSRAWLIAMQCFQLIYPIDQYDASNELTCAAYAIRFASKENKYQMRKTVYSFLMTKILDVLRRDAEVLSDGRDLIGFYQRTVYFDAAGAAEKTRLQDEPIMNAVTRSFAYCEALFDFIPDSFLRRNNALNDKAAEIARQWQTTYSYIAMRVGLYHLELTREQIHYGLNRYARYLRAVKNGEALMREIAPYNTTHEDQSLFFSDHLNTRAE